MKLPRFSLWIILFALLLLGISLSLILGSVAIPWGQFFGGRDLSDIERSIVYDLRFPRMLAAVVGGGALSLSGLLMQTLFRNPLAGPSVLGISSGSSLAVALITLGGAAWSAEPLSIIGGAMLGAFLILAIIAWVANRFYDIASVLIVGIMLSFFASALIGVLQSQATDQALKAFIVWGFGSFASVRNAELTLFVLPVLVIFALAPLLSKRLNAYMLGAEHAQSLGVQVSQLRLLTIAAAGILVAMVTAFCGPIAFIGLAAPHIARLVFRSADHRLILPASILIGGLFGVYCDLFARLPGSDSALPLNTVCSIIGAPIVILLLIRQRKKSIGW